MFKHSNKYPIYDIEAVTTPEGRRYEVPGGNIYESVTTALGKRSGKKEGLAEWRKRVGMKEANRISQLTSKRGTAVHKIIEGYLNNEDTHMWGFMPDAIAMFKSVQEILNEYVDIIYLQEAPLFSHTYKLAGRTDMIGYWVNHASEKWAQPALSVVDFKTSMKPKKEEWLTDYFLQGTAYAKMFEEMYHTEIEQIVLVIAVENDTPQIFIDSPYKYTGNEFFTERLRK